MIISRSNHPIDALKRLLWEEWDPIGVRGLGPADEYDSYAAKVFLMLNDGEPEGKIAAYLRWAATGNMGLSDAGDVDVVASKAMAIHRNTQ